MIAVSDTTAITTLLKAGRIDLLRSLFGRVLIPPAVQFELLRYHATIPPFCELHPVADSPRLAYLPSQADPGEAECVLLAVQTRADAVLMDDKKGRALAEAEGVRCLGLPALALAAKSLGLIQTVAEFLDLLERKGNYCLSARSKAAVLRQAGE